MQSDAKQYGLKFHIDEEKRGEIFVGKGARGGLGTWTGLGHGIKPSSWWVPNTFSTAILVG